MIKRVRVKKLLSTIYDFQLTIVEAPIGYGKTTAVKSFLQEQSKLYLWMTLINSGETAFSIWSDFSSEIEKVDKEAGITLKKLGFPEDAPQIEKVISILNNIDFIEDTVFVIDDYHLLSHDIFNKVIENIIMESIEHLHIVIITRDTTNMYFIEPFSRGICQVITQQQLKFTEEEVYEYCITIKKDILYNDIVKIYKYTDGWISLIYIILRGLDMGIPVGMNSTINELIEEFLFNSYDKNIQDFLLSISIMDNFTMKQVIFVTEDKNTEEILKKLCRENAFVIYDEANEIYKIHNVLMDFLRIKVGYNTGMQKKLYKRLGEWYLINKKYLNAYSYLNKAGEVERILSELNNPENASNELTEFEGSYEMFEKIPEEILFKYPVAYLKYIFNCILRGNELIIEKCNKRLDELKIVYEKMENIDNGYRNHIIAEILIIKKFTAFNDLEKMHAYNDEILRLLNGSQSFIMNKDDEFTFGSPHLLYIYYKDEGCLEKTAHSLKDKVNSHASYSNGNGIGSDYLALAEYSLETGKFEEAKLNSLKALYKARTKSQMSVILCSCFNLIRLYIYLDKIDETIEKLTELEDYVADKISPVHNTTLDLCKGYIYACINQPEKIPFWLQVGDMSSGDFFRQGIAFSNVVYGKSVMLSKNYVKLEMLSESFDEYFSIFNNRLGFIHNHIFRAVAKYHLYGIEEGIKELKLGLIKGQPDNIIMPFAENAPYIMDMLYLLHNYDSQNGYIKNVLNCSIKYNKIIEKSSSSRVILSQRELDVLLLAAEGLKRNEIANRLVISQGTVKTHLQNIYKKLNVSGKIEAVKIAKKYKIL